MHNIDNDDAPEAAPPSPARVRLGELIEARQRAKGEMDAARAAISRLTSTQNLSAPFERELAALRVGRVGARLWQSQRRRKWKSSP